MSEPSPLSETRPDLDADWAPARRRALEPYGILDTPAEQPFDDIAHFAARLCGAPAALVSFVDERRQWFKARIGFDDSETDLDRSVCKFALGAPDLFIIPDLTKDDRTRNNPLVSGEPGIRFYAGAPLRLGSGEVLGSLCVIDTAPRPQGLTAEQADDLRRLGRLVVDQLELRRILKMRDEVLAEQQALHQERETLAQGQAVLNAEISHRLKNTLAMVQAVAVQTLKGVTDRAAMDDFEQRLGALGAAHDLLFQEDWEHADLASVIHSVAVTLGIDQRLRVDGPSVALSPRATMTASLLVHELATNAIKYGALRVPSGDVSATWRVDEPHATLVFEWVERGGPAIDPPTRQGFGSKLLTMGFTGTGGTTLRYERQGFTAELTASIRHIQAS